MKRSEMVNLIAHSISDWKLENPGQFYPNYEMADYVLIKIQEAGIQPPRIRTDDIMYFDSERPEGYFPTSNIWDEDLEDLKNEKK